MAGKNLGIWRDGSYSPAPPRRRRESEGIVAVVEGCKDSRHAGEGTSEGEREEGCCFMMEARQPNVVTEESEEGRRRQGGEQRRAAASLQRREESHCTTRLYVNISERLCH